MEISANILAKIKIYQPENEAVQTKVSNFAAKFGGKLRADFWANFNARYRCTQDVMVCVQPDRRVRIIEVRRDRIFAHHVGELLKTHHILWVQDGIDIEVEWGNWKWVYRQLVPTRDKQVYDRYVSEDEEQSIMDARRKESDFYDLATSNRYKKMGKRGYNLTFNEQRARLRMEAAERRIYRTIKTATQIMGAM